MPLINSVRNRCKFGMLMLGKYHTYEKVKEKTNCPTFFYIRKSKENQIFCDRDCQKKFNDYIKGRIDFL